MIYFQYYLEWKDYAKNGSINVRAGSPFRDPCNAFEDKYNESKISDINDEFRIEYAFACDLPDLFVFFLWPGMKTAVSDQLGQLHRHRDRRQDPCHRQQVFIGLRNDPADDHQARGAGQQDQRPDDQPPFLPADIAVMAFGDPVLHPDRMTGPFQST